VRFTFTCCKSCVLLLSVVMEQAPISNKTWELSLYELHRTPQEVITDNTEIAVSPRSLHSELMCPICLDMLKNTMTTKECLHRSELICTCTSHSVHPTHNLQYLFIKLCRSSTEYSVIALLQSQLCILH